MSRRAGPRRARVALGGASLILLIAVVVAATRGGSPPPLPLPGSGRQAPPGDPFAYRSDRQGQFTARAVAGEEHVLFVDSPGGVLQTAARVAAWRPAITRAAHRTGIDPSLLEALVFLESAGRPDAIAGGGDPAAASGLTQIVAQTGAGLLGMHIDLAQSRRLTTAIARAAARGQSARLPALEHQRARMDTRFDPGRALAATVRYLELARQRFGRMDLAIESYHMGIGNLQSVLDAYDSGRPVPYVQLFFDTAPDHHPTAYSLLSGFGDDSWLYWWRILGAQQIMRLYRSDRAELARLDRLQVTSASNAQVLHPRDRTTVFGDPASLREAYAARTVVPLPRDPARLHLAYAGGIGAGARQLGQPAALYRGLRPAALDLLVALASRVRALSGVSSPLTLAGAVTDARYQQLQGGGDYLSNTGYELQILRSYVSRRQALAFQAMLDRLQALDLIAWVREPVTIDITVASDASQVIVGGP